MKPAFGAIGMLINVIILIFSLQDKLGLGTPGFH